MFEGRGSPVERSLCWGLIGLVALVGVIALRDAWLRVGRVAPGFALMENGQTGAGGAPRGGLAPLDVITGVNGRPVSGAAEILAEVDRHPSGTALTYSVRRGSQRLVATLPTRTITPADFGRSLIDGTLPGALVLALGTLVFVLRPGTPESRLFLAFCLASATLNLTYNDLVTTHRFTRLLLVVWTFTPALLLHLALTFPERRRLVDRWPWVIPLPYVASAGLAAWLLATFTRFTASVGEIVAGYSGLAGLALIASLGWTVWASPTLAARRRARVLLWGVGIGYVLPLLGTSAEIVSGTTVPQLHLVWQLNFVFPASVAYAIARYQLFDVRAAVRMGAVYSAVTGLVALAYVGLLTGIDLLLARMHLDVAPVVSSAGVALAVVLLMNPIYGRVRRFVDRLFFRDRYDAQRALESLAHQMTTVLELDRLQALVTRTADELFRPEDVALLLPADGAGELRGLSRAGHAARLAADGPLMRILARLRVPVTRTRLGEDPDLAAEREAGLAELEAAGAAAAAPVFFRDRVTAVLALGRRRSGADFVGEDLRVLRTLADQSAVALENARAYRALEAALRRVQILESIRANLAKFVPRVVQDLIERAPEAPALAKREVDVSVLFVDIVGYSRLSDRLDAARLNRLVERYFGAFLDEILGQGGDVNETAGDGLMVIFQDADPRRHAVAAALAGLGVLRRTAEINAETDEPGPPPEPIGVHVGVNSGVAAVGATRIEGVAGTRWTYTASGPVTNVAARLAALGEGDAVMLGWQTRRRLGPEFAAEDLGEAELKNIDEPVRVFRLRPPRREARAGAVPATGRRD
jgi:class 3 adenylate cyclase